MEVCPSCGDLVEELDEKTGWCLACTGIEFTFCIACRESFKRDKSHRKLCRWCRDERWLARNADALESELATGITISEAKRRVYAANKPKCLSCGFPIAHGRDGAYFCRRTSDCRKWSRRYRTLRERYMKKGVQDPKKKALSMVNAEIFVLGQDNVNNSTQTQTIQEAAVARRGH